MLILCMSANAFGSDWAQLERQTFQFRDPLNKERRFIPLRLDDAHIKGSLAQFRYIDWRPAEREQEYAKLLEILRESQKAQGTPKVNEAGWSLARPEDVVIDTDSRHDFPARTKDTLARRVGMLCSNPDCRKPTSGPQSDPNEVINIGVAVHITAAAVGGPRYAAALSKRERTSINNGIWLCQNCAKLVDNDPGKYTTTLLREWKANAENVARRNVEAGTAPSKSVNGFLKDRHRVLLVCAVVLIVALFWWYKYQEAFDRRAAGQLGLAPKFVVSLR